MKKPGPTRFFRYLFQSSLLLLLLGVQGNLNAQISFSKSDLDLNGQVDITGVTSLMYGPDGRLYVAEYPPGTINVLTIDRNAASDYVVTDVEVLTGVTDIVNHDDDGSINSSQTQREVTGLTVAGTAANPIIYVTSSDYRIGSGPGGGSGDLGLDTNSGIITRFNWNGGSWDVVDLVRGLPRSEENHATNGLEMTTINGTDYLIVSSGGNTNGGAPSTNFVHTCEYALSGAVLSVNLDMLNSMGIQTDGNGRQYIYDIPTLDDPTRANVNGITDPDTSGYTGIDVNDPWGGNDGLNQAMIVPGGPVQIFSPGYRNTYDLVVTQSGAVYVTDNGANVHWGGLPVNEGGGSVTNAYDPAELGSFNPTADGEAVNNEDHLELITNDIQNYTFGSFYAGHPNPIRANPNGAGLYTAPNQYGTTGAVFRTQVYDPDGSTPGSTNDPNVGLPANWPPVATANPVEGDWRGPGMVNPDGPADVPITIWGTNTNGIDEYTATNFGGAMQGDLLAGHNAGVLRRVQLNPNGSLQNLTPIFLSNIGGNALGVTCNSDTDAFPGTIWIGTLNGKIVVFEPQDYGTGNPPVIVQQIPDLLRVINAADENLDLNTYFDDDNGTANLTYTVELNTNPAIGASITGNILTLSYPSTPEISDITIRATDAESNFVEQTFTVTVTDGTPFIVQDIPDLIRIVNSVNEAIDLDNYFDDDNGTANLVYSVPLNSNPAIGTSISGNTLTLTFPATPEISDITVRATDADTNFVEQIFTVTVVDNSIVLYRTNAGGPQLTHSGNIFSADDFFQGGSAFANTNALVPQLYQTERTAASLTFDYAFPVSDGDYRVILHFAEIYWGATGGGVGGVGSRIFDVSIEGTAVLDNYDINADVGPENPVAKVFNVTVADGELTIHFSSLATDGGVDQPKVSAIEVIGVVSNEPPVAVASAVPTMGTAPLDVNFTGSNSTDDVAVVSYLWDFKDGTTSTQPDPVHTFTSPNTYIVELTVEDAEGLSDTSSITIIVDPPPNESPVAVATASPTSGPAPLQVTFTGSNSTDDVGITGYLWDFKDGSAQSTAANPVHTFTVAGTYQVELTVEDAEGLSDTTTVTIIVDATSNEAPVAVASASPTSGNTPLEVSFTGSNSTDDVAVVSYLWDFKDGTTSTLADPVHTFTTANTYIVELTVEDGEGLSDTTSISIIVTDPVNQPPVAFASASPSSGLLPLEVTFTGSNSTDDVGVVSYLWDFKDGSPLATEADPVHTFTVVGTYLVQLTVTDDEGLTDTATVTVIVNDGINQAPVAIIDATPLQGDAPLEVNFTGRNSTDDKGVIDYLWDFGDGSASSTEITPNHIFALDGNYTVSLTVTDAEGLSNTTTIIITVLELSGEKDLYGLLLVNPAKEIAQVRIVDNGPSNRSVTRIYIHNVSGQQVAVYNPQDIFANGLYEIPISRLGSGTIYLIGFEMNTSDTVVLKLVVMN